MVLKNNKDFGLGAILSVCAMPLILSYAFSSLSNVIKFEDGLYYLLLMFNFASVCDMGAYFVGSAMGKHKLCPNVSPKKTVEGAFGGIISSMIVSAILAAVFGKDIMMVIILIPAVNIVCNKYISGSVDSAYMNKPNTTSKIENNVHIEQNTPQNELNNLEKTTIFQFLKEENILKEKNKKTETIKQKIIKEDIYAKINSNETHKTIENELEMPKRKNNLSNTIKIKLSDLRAAVRQREKEELERKRRENKNKSLYDTIIIKLDDIINNRKALKCFSANKVIKTELPLHHDIKKDIFDKVKDITKIKKFTLNVDSEEFMNQINNLNIIALTKLSTKKNIKIRDYKKYKKKYKYDKVKIKKEDLNMRHLNLQRHY